MGHSQAEKAQSRERILDEAARQVRSGGLGSLSIPALMKSVGLTHGGFYGHFRSKADLQAQAVQRALEDNAVRIPWTSFPAGVEKYLSQAHRDRPAAGCAVAALVSEAGRADEATRQVMESAIEALNQKVKPACGDDDEKALAAVATMVGALAMSRVFTDRERSAALLKAARKQVIALGDAADA